MQLNIIVAQNSTLLISLLKQNHMSVFRYDVPLHVVANQVKYVHSVIE